MTTALITGASSGIVLEMVKLIGTKNYNLVLVARNEDTLQALASDIVHNHKVDVTAIATDLCKPRAAESVWQATQAKGIHIDCLINNAGFASAGNLEGVAIFDQGKTAESVAHCGIKAMEKGELMAFNEAGLKFTLN